MSLDEMKLAFCFHFLTNFTNACIDVVGFALAGCACCMIVNFQVLSGGNCKVVPYYKADINFFIEIKLDNHHNR